LKNIWSDDEDVNERVKKINLILRDAVLRTAPQDEVVDFFTRSSTRAGAGFIR
jgi:hypothetical protein